MAEYEREGRRSRSKVRSHLRNEFRIRDETNETTKNLKQVEVNPNRDHRSLSRAAVPGIKRDYANENQLLQQAIQNRNLRASSPGIHGSGFVGYRGRVSSSDNGLRSKSSSGRLISDSRTKNIPMSGNYRTSSRPAIKRWNSIQYLSNDPQDNLKTRHSYRTSAQHITNNPNPNLDPDSVSPLTVLKDQYNTKRPVSNAVSKSTDNYYKDLETPSKYQMTVSGPNDNNLMGSDLEDGNKTNTTSPMESITNKIYNKMTRLLQRHDDSSLKQITPTSSNNPNLTRAGDKLNSEKSIPLSAKTSILKFQSELDDESEMEDDPELIDPNGNDQFDPLSSPNVNLQESSTINEVNFDKIMDEINDFQNNFVQKFNVNTPNSATSKNEQDSYDWDSSSSRIQRKILDYKDLYNQDDNLSKNSSYFSLKLQNQLSYNILNDYTFKIQHETIMQQYNLIRFRYLSPPDFHIYTIDGEPIYKDKVQHQYLKSNMGVLGFLNRAQLVEAHNKEKASKQSPNNRIVRDSRNFEQGGWLDMSYNKNTVADPHQYLNSLWEEEMECLFHSEAGTNGPGTENGSTNEKLRESLDGSINASVSDLAGKVKFQL